MESWFLRQALDYAVGRLKEPSTWAAIAAGLAADLHLRFSDDFTRSFISLGIAAGVFLGVVLKERVSK